ncbi:hypothetical protein LDENG_00082330, partial [Lucifuga dentata]
VHDYGLKLKRKKCQFGVSEVTFLGDKISAEGVCVSVNEVQALHEKEKPKDKNGVQRALGMVNYMGKFILIICQQKRPTSENCCIETHTSNGVLNMIKNGLLVLSREPVLRFFQPDKKNKSVHRCF